MPSVDYSGIVDDAIARLKTEGRYRSFAEIERIPGTASAMLHAPDGTTRTVAVWCSNDYLGMAANATVVEAVCTTIDAFCQREDCGVVDALVTDRPQPVLVEEPQRAFEGEFCGHKVWVIHYVGPTNIIGKRLVRLPAS